LRKKADVLNIVAYSGVRAFAARQRYQLSHPCGGKQQPFSLFETQEFAKHERAFGRDVA